MPDTLFYSIVKVVPHPLREEALNLGVVVVSEDGTFAEYRFAKGFKERLRALAPDVNPALVEAFVEDFDETLRPHDKGPVTRLTARALSELAGRFGYQFQISMPRSVLSQDPEVALAELFDEYVAPPSAAPRNIVDRPTIRQRVKHALREWKVPNSAVVPTPPLPVQHGTNHMDLGIKRANGAAESIAVALEPISFEVQTQETIRHQRDHVAWIARDLDPTAQTPALCVVLSGPSPANRGLYQESREMLSEFDVQLVQIGKMTPLRRVLAQSGVAID
jgi:hypothetical protein